LAETPIKESLKIPANPTRQSKLYLDTINKLSKSQDHTFLAEIANSFTENNESPSRPEEKRFSCPISELQFKKQNPKTQTKSVDQTAKNLKEKQGFMTRFYQDSLLYFAHQIYFVLGKDKKEQNGLKLI